MRAILVDDERLARRSLRSLLAAHAEIEIVGEAASAAQALNLIRSERPDVVFLDIQMPRASGFDLLEVLEDPPAIIFITAYDEYAVRAFEVNALDYLLKPVDPERLAATVRRLFSKERQRALEQQPFRADDMVWIKTAGKGFLLRAEEIVAIQAAGNYSYLLCTRGEQHLVRRSLKQWAVVLPADIFLVLDRSLIINRQRVATWETRGRKIAICLDQATEPIELGRTASRRFREEILPEIEKRRPEPDRQTSFEK